MVTSFCLSIWTCTSVARQEAPGLRCHRSPAQDGAGERGPPLGPHSLWKALRPGAEGTVPLGVGGARLADGPEWKPHAREEGVPGVRGQGGVGGGVGRHSPVAQRRRVDVRIEPRGEGRVG